MTLRRRLLLSLLLILPLSLLVGGVLSYVYALSSVEKEMKGVLQLSEASVREALAAIGADDTQAMSHVKRIVQNFHNDRDVKVSLVEPSGRVLVQSRTAPARSVPPAWLSQALSGANETLLVGLPGKLAALGSLKLETVPDNEIIEIWNEMKLQGAILAGFFTLILWLVSYTLDKALRPLDKLASAMATVGQGNFATRIDESGPRELNTIYREFNTMALRLKEAEQRNASLSRELSAVQEEERKDLARELHDEIGPFLFASDVDAQAVSQYIDRSELDQAKRRAAAIRQSITHMQGHLRSVLIRLRPAMLELGLAHAVDHLVTFWKSRHPVIAFDVSIAQESFGASADAVAFRTVQEAINNAIRHGRPTAIEIVADVVPGHPPLLALSVTDNGGGMKPKAVPGFGISGMRERLAAISGALDIAANPRAPGVKVLAHIPLTEPPPQSQLQKKPLETRLAAL